MFEISVCIPVFFPLFQLFFTLNCPQRNGEGFVRFLSAGLYICREKRKKKKKKERRGDKKNGGKLWRGDGYYTRVDKNPSLDRGRWTNELSTSRVSRQNFLIGHETRVTTQDCRDNIRRVRISQVTPFFTIILPPPRIYGASRCRA